MIPSAAGDPDPTPETGRPREAHPSFLRSGIQGLLWTAGGQSLAQATHLLVRLILARLLLPQDFGLVAMAMLFISFTDLLVDLGVTSALVQRPRLTDEERSTAFWTTTGIGLAASVLFALAAPLAASFFRAPSLAPVVRVLGLSLIFSSAGSTFFALLQRELSFRALGLRQVGAILAGGSVGVAAALAGAGVWALVAEALTRSLTGSILLVLQSAWKPSATFSSRALRELWSFGKHIIGSRLFNYFNRNLDTLLIGRFLGATALGIYSLSYQAVLIPLQYFARPVAQVGLPILAALQGDSRRAGNAYLRTLEGVVFVTWPGAVLAALAAPVAIPLVLGQRWEAAVLPFQILCAVGMLQSPISLCPSVFTAFGRPELLLRWTAVAFLANAAGMATGLRWGPPGVAAGYLAAVILTSPLHVHWVASVLSLPRRRLAGVLSRGLAAALVLLGTWLLAGRRLELPHPLLELAALASLSCIAYALAARILLPSAWAVVRDLLRKGPAVTEPAGGPEAGR